MNERLPRPETPHPTPEEIYRAKGARDESSRRVLDHVVVCARCSEEQLLQQAFDREPGPFESVPAPVRERFEPRRRTLPVWLVAVPAALALGVVALLLRKPGDVPRSDPSAALARSPAGELREAPREFVLAPHDDAVQILVFDAGKTYVWKSPEARGPTVPFPDAERLRLSPGVTYYWTVVRGGAEEPAKSFRVTPGS